MAASVRHMAGRAFLRGHLFWATVFAGGGLKIHFLKNIFEV